MKALPNSLILFAKNEQGELPKLAGPPVSPFFWEKNPQAHAGEFPATKDQPMSVYPKPVSARLLTYPHYPLETLFLIWEQSKHNRPIPTPFQVSLILGKENTSEFNSPALGEFVAGYGTLEQFKAHYQEVVSKILREDVPCEEEIWFVFLIEDLPVALREQMYRHKVGTQVGPRIGFDIVPDLTESSFWAQSHRVLDMSHFFNEKQYFIPESIKKNRKMTSMVIGELDRGGVDGSPPEWGPLDLEVEEVFNHVLKTCQTGYAALVEAGIPPEDARNVLPFAVTHRTTWAINLKALAHVIGKRSCWLMQRGMWERLIASMVEELCVNVDPCFRFLVEPPCFKAGAFQACPFPQSNNERIIGLDPNPPCPLYLSKHAEEARDVSENCFSRLSRAPAWQPAHGPEGWITNAADQNTRMGLERRAFQRLWRRDVDSGEPVG